MMCDEQLCAIAAFATAVAYLCARLCAQFAGSLRVDN